MTFWVSLTSSTAVSPPGTRTSYGSSGHKKLDAVEYLTRHVIPRAQAGSLDSELLRQILAIIYDERPQLDAHGSARALLSGAPLVPCMDGQARAAVAVHSPNRAMA